MQWLRLVCRGCHSSFVVVPSCAASLQWLVTIITGKGAETVPNASGVTKKSTCSLLSWSNVSRPWPGTVKDHWFCGARASSVCNTVRACANVRCVDGSVAKPKSWGGGGPAVAFALLWFSALWIYTLQTTFSVELLKSFIRSDPAWSSSIEVVQGKADATVQPLLSQGLLVQQS